MSKPLLIIGNKNYSSWSLRPWLFMKYFEVDFDEKRIALFTDSTDSELAAYRSDNKVPVLQDNELVVWDSYAIVEYVSDKYLNGRGWPEDISQRAFARSVSAEMHSSFPCVRNEMPMNCRKQVRGLKLSSQAESEIERIKYIWNTCRQKFGEQGPWLFGNFSIADAMYAPVVIRFTGYGIGLNSTENMYVNTVLSLPAIQEWIDAGKNEKEVMPQYEFPD